MAAPSVTYSFTNGTTSDATQVNTNFTNIINAFTDGSADLTIGTLTANGAVTFKGTVGLGDSSADDITITGSLASTITIKTNATYNIGSATSGLAGLYLGYGANKTVKLAAGATATSWTLTLPADAPAVTGQGMIFDTSGNATWRYADKFTAAKTTNYNATGDETVILCDPTTGGASFTVTLPAASTMTGKSLTVIKIDSGLTYTVTIDGNASETIYPSNQSGNLTYILYTQYESVTLKCNGTSWYVTGHYWDTSWNDGGTLSSKLTATTTAPTIGSATIAINQLWWRRAGANAEVRGEFRKTATGTATNGTGDYLFGLPTGLTIDTNKVTVYATVEGAGGGWSTNNIVGSGSTTDNTTCDASIPSVYDSTNIRLFYVGSQNGTSGLTGCVGSGGRAMAGAAVIHYLFYISVPISGWNG